ncbi:hypothetical protein GmHk_18G051834 [Glycine max]|nr:hypothetical protein GmHk_18G051834 [Glycine max]
MYSDAFVGLNIPKDLMRPYLGVLVGFVGEEIEYNVLLENLSLNKLGAIVLTTHLKVKFPLEDGSVGKINVNQEITRKCCQDSL